MTVTIPPHTLTQAAADVIAAAIIETWKERETRD